MRLRCVGGIETVGTQASVSPRGYRMTWQKRLAVHHKPTQSSLPGRRLLVHVDRAGSYVDLQQDIQSDPTI